LIRGAPGMEAGEGEILPAWEAFFFDFDGVLADSLEVKTLAFARLFEPHGPEIVARVIDHHRNHGGVTRVEKFRHYYREFLQRPLSPEELADLCRRFARLVVDEVVDASEIPGAEAFLRSLPQELPCFVISAAPQEEVEEIVQRRGWAGYFRELRGAPASKRENLENLLRKYRFTPGRCLFFGDAESDYQAARTCGVNFLGIVPGPEAPLLQAAPGIQWRRDFIGIVLPPSAPGTCNGRD
jgi:beta-phosphoglucomutase-like phosphatase (HAD superfamily)